MEISDGYIGRAESLYSINSKINLLETCWLSRPENDFCAFFYMRDAYPEKSGLSSTPINLARSFICISSRFIISV